MDELLARLRVTQRRLNLLASDSINSPVFVNGPLKIDFSAGCVWLSENELHLTPIEYKLLCVLAHNVGKVLTHTSLTQKYGAVRRKMTLLPCEFTWHPCAKNWNDARMRRI